MYKYHIYFDQFHFFIFYETILKVTPKLLNLSWPSARGTDTYWEDSNEVQDRANTLAILGKLQVWRAATS